jgi:hypothetical protein
VDFLHSRLAPPHKPRVDRRIVWAVAVGLVVLLLAAFEVHEQHVDQAELDGDTAKYKAMDQRIKSATAEVGKIEYAHQWQGGTPHYVSCLRDLTNVLPDDGMTYLTSFDLRENKNFPREQFMEGTLSGKTKYNEAPVLAAGERMKASKNFRKVTTSFNVRDTREGREVVKEVTFTISFEYIGHD